MIGTNRVARARRPRFQPSSCMKTIWMVLFGGVLLVARLVQGGSIEYPEEIGVLNVREPPYGARGDGAADDTAAIQRALAAGLAQHRVVYLPNGIYRVSDTLRWRNGDSGGANGGWGPFLQLQGQSRAGTVLQLVARAPGFDDPANPKAVIQTGSSASSFRLNINL